MILKNPVYKNKKDQTIKNIGGMVTSIDPAFIGADQLSDGYNLWNKNGIISSRPAFCATENGLITDNLSGENIKLYYSDFPFENISEYNNFCALVKDAGFSGSTIDFFAIDTQGVVHKITSLEFKSENASEKYDIKNLIFIKSKKITGSGIFIILPIHTTNVLTLEEKKEVKYYELNSDYTAFTNVLPERLYRPIILKNGNGNLAPNEIRRDFKASHPEGVSLINGLFEARFILDGKSFCFQVPTAIDENSTIEIRFYTSDVSYKTAYIEAGNFRSDNFICMSVEIYATVNRKSGRIYFRQDGADFPMPKMTDIESLRIYARADVSGAAYEVFSSPVSPILFDSRIFVAGGENRGNKLYYSSKTEHLYFCESYSVSVGNKSYDLTALSMQSKYLIAFKEKEIYRLSIKCTDEVTMQDMDFDTKGLVYEKPKCTVTQINDTIGCDLPNTIVTCANRLVWFHSDGCVYTLYGSNLYTEGSIYDLSSDISNLLTDIPKEKLKTAFAADLNGYYTLGIYDKLFLMDVRVSGFRYLAKQKSQKESVLNWFLWYSPKDTYFISSFLCGGKEYFILSSDNSKVIYTAKLYGEKDVIALADKTQEETPPFYIATAIFGENSNVLNKISVNALIKNDAEFKVFDQNGDLFDHKISASDNYKSYIFNAPYKKGGIGIKIKGSGEFKLKDIVCSFNERIY